MAQHGELLQRLLQRVDLEGLCASRADVEGGGVIVSEDGYRVEITAGEVTLIVWRDDKPREFYSDGRPIPPQARPSFLALVEFAKD